MKRFISFGIIGSVGFLVDASLLLVLVHIAGYSIVISRVCSFVVAVLATWLLNRYFTFSTQKMTMTKSKEYFYYFVIQLIGALINFCIFFILIYLFESMKEVLILPLAIGAGFSLVFNYLMIKTKVYIHG